MLISDKSERTKCERYLLKEANRALSSLTFNEKDLISNINALNIGYTVLNVIREPDDLTLKLIDKDNNFIEYTFLDTIEFKLQRSLKDFFTNNTNELLNLRDLYNHLINRFNDLDITDLWIVNNLIAGGYRKEILKSTYNLEKFEIKDIVIVDYLSSSGNPQKLKYNLITQKLHMGDYHIN